MKKQRAPTTLSPGYGETSGSINNLHNVGQDHSAVAKKMNFEDSKK